MGLCCDLEPRCPGRASGIALHTRCENAVPEDDSALQNVEALGPIFGVILNISIGVLSALVLTALIALTVRIMLRTRPRIRCTWCAVPAFTRWLSLALGLG